MSDKSTIEWTEATLNPWTGCTKVSPGCARCYIPRTMPFRTAGRDFDRKGHIPLVFHMERLEKMVRRRKPTMYFVNSLSDLFHEDASDQQIAQVFASMALARQHTFQVLTKRPDRMVELLRRTEFLEAVEDYRDRRGEGFLEPPMPWPLPNVWLGVTIENRQFVRRADLLRQTPAAVRFISAEPLLGPLVYDSEFQEPGTGGWVPCWSDTHSVGEYTHWGDPENRQTVHPTADLDLADIDWLICGGESGKGARRFDLQWARDLRDACQASGTAFFLKQDSGPRPGMRGRIPDDLWIQEWPRAYRD